MEADARTRARRIAEARYGFRWHALIYVRERWSRSDLVPNGGISCPLPSSSGNRLASHYMSAYHSLADWVRETEKDITAADKEKVSGS